MKNIVRKKKILTILLASLLSQTLSGCANDSLGKEKPVVNYEDIIKKPEKIAEKPKEIMYLETVQPIITSVIEEIERYKKFINIPCVITTSRVDVFDNTIDGNLIGKVPEGTSLEMLDLLDNEWYEVIYYGDIAYIKKENLIESKTYELYGNILKICYATEDIELTIPKKVSKSGFEEVVILPEFECLEIYYEYENEYLVKTNDYVGYVKKEFLEELSETTVVVDISDQEFKLYYKNELILTSPVVTGKPSSNNTITHTGIFDIYDISEKRYLIGDGYKSYIDVMMKFNGNEGLHDAEYHYCDNPLQKNHGWRALWEFGGDTYITNGSHGCVNMPHDAAIKTYEYVNNYTKVLVKN